MKYADMRGLANVLEDLRAFAKEDPVFWRPSNLMVELVDKSKLLNDLNAVA
jgi:3-hydroxyacyl-CoA dehydrogenase